MSQHNRLFEEQRAASRRIEVVAREQNAFASLLCFETNGGAYAVPITSVREVVDSYAIMPYPERVAGHVGIASIRGQVLPVVSPTFAGETDVSASRLLVLEFREHEPFCVAASRVYKALVDTTDSPDGTVMNINGKPARLVGEADFFVSEADHDRD